MARCFSSLFAQHISQTFHSQRFKIHQNHQTHYDRSERHPQVELKYFSYVKMYSICQISTAAIKVCRGFFFYLLFVFRKERAWLSPWMIWQQRTGSVEYLCITSVQSTLMNWLKTCHMKDCWLCIGAKLQNQIIGYCVSLQICWYNIGGSSGLFMYWLCWACRWLCLHPIHTASCRTHSARSSSAGTSSPTKHASPGCFHRSTAGTWGGQSDELGSGSWAWTTCDPWERSLGWWSAPMWRFSHGVFPVLAS